MEQIGQCGVSRLLNRLCSWDVAETVLYTPALGKFCVIGTGLFPRGWSALDFEVKSYIDLLPKNRKEWSYTFTHTCVFLAW